MATLEPSPESTQHPPPVASDWWRWGRWVVLVVACLIAGWGVALKPRGSYSSAGELAGAWIAGALAYAVWIHVVGFVVYAVKDQRGRPSTFSSTTYSRSVLLTSLMLAFVLVAGQASRRAASDRTGAAQASGTASGANLNAAQRGFLAFQKDFSRCELGPGRAYFATNKRTLDDLNARRVSAIKTDFGHVLTEAHTYHDCLASLPGGTPELQAVVARLSGGGSLLIKASSEYVRGWGPPLQKTLLSQGDADFTRAGSELKQAATAGDAVYHRLGGASVLGDQLALPSVPH